MTQGWRRVIAAGAVVTVVAAIFATPSNAVGASGVGSAGGSTALAGLDAGDLLKLQAVVEQSSASIDPANGTPTASETLSPLTVASNTLTALNSLTVPSVSTTSTGAADSKSTEAIDLASLPQPAPVLSGQIAPASLSSLVDADGAHASMSSSLANIAVAGGVAKIDSANVDLGGVAGPNQSTSTRSVTVDGVTVLDLRALLQMVGLDLNKLPLETLTGLIDQLGLIDTLNALTGQNFGSGADIVAALTTPAITSAQDAVNTAQAAVNSAQATYDAALSQLDAANQAVTTATSNFNAALCNVTFIAAICQPLQDALNVALGAQTAAQAAVDAAKSVLDAAVATLNAALDALDNLLGQLQGVLQGLADTLDLQPLLRIEGIEVGSTATAVDTVANSTAVTTGTIGNVQIGGINLGGLDVGATLDQVAALATQATQAVDNVLSVISPKLADLVHIELFKHATDVSQSGSYVNAVAGITGLLATVTPPDVCGVLNDVLTKLPVGLNSLPGVTLPSLPVSDVLSTLGSTIDCTVPGILRQQAIVPALVTPITVAAAQANSVASFAAAQQATTTTTTTPGTPSTSTGTGTPTTTSTPLARTGAENTLYLLAGALLLTVAYATRRTMIAARAEAGSRR